jgi:hypothetical protein
MLDFAKADLARLSPAQWTELRDILRSFTHVSTLTHPGDPVSQEDVELAQVEIRRFLTALAYRNHYELPVEGSLVFLPAEDPAARQPLTKARGRGPRLQLIQELYGHSLAAAIIQSAADLLRRVGLARLMACPFRPNPDGPPCGQLFLARRRQLFCSVEHSKAHALRVWRQAEQEKRRQQQTRMKRTGGT